MEKLLIGASPRWRICQYISAVKGSSPSKRFIEPEELDLAGCCTV
jgi:hypothetical protein